MGVALPGNAAVYQYTEADTEPKLYGRADRDLAGFSVFLDVNAPHDDEDWFTVVGVVDDAPAGQFSFTFEPDHLVNGQHRCVLRLLHPTLEVETLQNIYINVTPGVAL